MTKILVSAKALQQLFKDEPVLEVELINNASAQVAEAFKRKIDTNAMVNQMVANLEQQLSYRHNPVSNKTQEIIKAEASAAVKKIVASFTGDMIKDAVRKAMDDHKIWIHNNLNGIIIDKVNAAMRAATEAAVKGALR